MSIRDTSDVEFIVRVPSRRLAEKALQKLLQQELEVESVTSEPYKCPHCTKVIRDFQCAHARSKVIKKDE